MTRYLIIPLNKEAIADQECIDNIILAPTMNQANRHADKMKEDKKFPNSVITPIETNFSYAMR